MSSLVMWLILILVQGDGVTAEVFQQEEDCQERLAELQKLPNTLGLTQCTKIQMQAVEKSKA